MTKKKNGRVVTQLKPGNAIFIGEDIIISLARAGKHPRLMIVAPLEVEIRYGMFISSVEVQTPTPPEMMRRDVKKR